MQQLVKTLLYTECIVQENKSVGSPQNLHIWGVPFPRIRETGLLLFSNNISIAELLHIIKSGKNCRMNMWNYPIDAHH